MGVWYVDPIHITIRGCGRLLFEGTIMKDFVEKFKIFAHSVIDFFRRADSTVLFVLAVTAMVILRAMGMASLAVFLALVYIMWFVSAGRR